MRFAVVLGLLAACGDGLPGPDAMPLADTPLGLVRVRSGAEDDQVVFQAADSSLVLVTRTDADGTANAYMPPGGFVTVITNTAGQREMFTWADVQPGDELALADPMVEAPLIQLNIPVDAGQGSYQLYTQCGAHSILPAAGSWLAIRLDGCPARIAMLVESIGVETHYLFSEDVTLAEGAMISLPPPYRPLDRTTIYVSDPDGRTTRALVGQRIVSRGRRIFDNGVVFTVSLTDGAGGTSFGMPLPQGTTLVTQVDPIDPITNGTPEHAFVWGPAYPTTRVDLGAMRVRSIVDPPAYDRAANELRWTEASDGIRANAVNVRIVWFRPEIGDGVRWNIAAPRGDDPVVHLPVLPGDLMPRAGDTFGDPAGNQFYSLALSEGYDASRARLLTRSGALAIPIISESGTAGIRGATQPIKD